MGLLYTYKNTNVALSTTNDSLTIVGAAARSWRVVEINVGGNGTASAANIFGVYRVTTAGSTGSGALTATPTVLAAPAAAQTNFTGWTTQPVVGALLLALPFNANGGVFRWVASPYSQLEVQGGNNATASLSFRGVLGNSNFTFNVVVEEF